VYLAGEDPMLTLITLFASALAAVRSDVVTWTRAGTTYSGWVVYDDATKDKRPGLVMVPNWYGANASALEKAKAIAGTKYVVLVADVYGKDVRPTDPKAAGEAAGKLYGDRAELRARAAAARDALVAEAARAPLDTTRVGAIGFCFGGSTVLELARSGAPLAGVVSFHGGLSTTTPAAAGAVKTPVLVLNGAADSYVKPEEITAFQQEMTTAGADWQLVQFGGAVHCFAEADAKSPPGCVYDERSAKRAYTMMDSFFAERFAK
jgi:dienelactone hydrolase